MKKNKKIGIRRGIQVFFFLFIALISLNHSLVENGRAIPFLSSASMHALCPFGGITSIYQFITSGTLVKKLHESSFVLMAIGILLATLFGPLFCGWICPLGTLQEGLSKIGKRIFKKKYNNFIPYKYDKYLRYLRYAVLAWVIYMTAITGKIAFEAYDPFYSLFNLWSSELAVSGVIILVLVILASLFVERPWCKYTCPYGAFLGVFNLFRIFKIKRNSSSCVSCKMCDSNCPMNIKVSQNNVVRDHQCISCMKCTSEEACSVVNTVNMSSNLTNKSLKPLVAGIISVMILFGGIAVSSKLNLWSTESEKIPVKYTSGELMGQAKPEDIRGSYTLDDIFKSYGVPVNDLAEAFGIKGVESLKTFKVKEFEAIYSSYKGSDKEIGTENVRFFVAMYNGMPYNLSKDIYLPKPASEILKEKGKLSEEQMKYVNSHLVEVPK
ncbi:4Fe-4S binding protein [Clostridium sp. SYSU_GA19001]|uniref:4Fe-4S binding protein n=1 Tax=Clostridium caldaquaticum TaxID=2940653 RepID=UPI00207772A8|nr:4Fe-4S binding protein [Clostridium caldaquaticum]MCM8709448.1 4Fe-4S binding protein [Clostridium caldaquaticum]